jgi:uncharacterized membrane-anchored protein
MFSILWFLFIAFATTISLVWILDHNGVVLVTWLGYEAKTDILTALLIAIAFAAIIFVFSYIVARILAMKFPNLFKLFFKKSYIKRLEAVIHRQWQGVDVASQLLLSLESEDVKNSISLQKKLASLIKNPQLNNFFLGKIYYQSKDFSKAAEFFAKIENSKFAKIMVMICKFETALEKHDNSTAIAYAKQILALQKDNARIVKALFGLYKKEGLWQEAKALINSYNAKYFSDELQKRDVAVMNAAIALKFYRHKNLRQASKFAKLSLKADENFLPALEILLKCLIKRGFAFRAKMMIKKLLQENPCLIFVEIFDFTNRKSGTKKRLEAIKKLVAGNKTYLSDLALGLVALRAGSYKEAEDFLYASIAKEKTYMAYKALGVVEKMLGNAEKSRQFFENSAMFTRENRYKCSVCGHLSFSWNADCDSCNSHASFEWGM